MTKFVRCLLNVLHPFFLFVLQMNTVSITSPGATWFPNMAFATISSTDSGAVNPARARSRRTLRSQWHVAFEGSTSSEAVQGRLLTTPRTLPNNVFSSWSTWPMHFVKKYKSEHFCWSKVAADALLPKRRHQVTDYIWTGETLQITSEDLLM